LGATFKENVSDIRNSKVVDVINELLSFSVHVDIYDPKADAGEFKHEYNLPLVPVIGSGYDGIVAAVSHSEFELFDEPYFNSITSIGAVFIDIKGTYRGKISTLEYWSL
jgi:UDP-N-acetyl-D-galactosamine dehydrogenase